MKLKILLALTVLLLSACKPVVATSTPDPTATKKPAPTITPKPTDTNEPWPWPTFTPKPKTTPTDYPTYAPLPTDIPARLDFPLPDETFFYQNKPDNLYFCFPNHTSTSITDFYYENLSEFDWKAIGFGCWSGTVFYPASFTHIHTWVKKDSSEQVDIFVNHEESSGRTCIVAKFNKCD